MNRDSSLLYFFLRVVMPFSFAFAWILSTGPQVQTYLLSFLNSDVPSIYGSAYKSKLIQLLPLTGWIKDGLSWIYLVMAFCIIAYSLRNGQPRKVLWRATVSSFFVLTTFDTMFGFIYHNSTWKSFVENSVSNLIGGLFIAVLLVGLISVVNFLFIFVPAPRRTREITAVMVTLLGGVAFVCVTYYIIDLFYNPLSVQFETHLAAPLNGDLIRIRPTGNVPEGNFPDLLVPAKATHAEMSWISPNGSQSVTMSAAIPSKKFNVAFALLTGPCEPEDVMKLTLDKHLKNIEGVTEAQISFDFGGSTAYTVKQGPFGSKFSLDTEKLSIFWLSKGAKDSNVSLTRFLNPDALLTVTKGGGDSIFLLTAPVISFKGDKAALSARLLSLRFDKRVYSIKFSPQMMSKGTVSKCAAASASEMLDDKNLDHVTGYIGGVPLYANVLVKISQEDDPIDLSPSETKLRITGGGGWARFEPLEVDVLANHSVGKLEMVQVKGNIAELALDNVAVAARPQSMYTAIGDFEAHYGTEGKLVVSGKATSLWKDSDRLNMTKWEKLGWEAMLFLIGTFFTGIGFAGSLLIKCLRENEEFAWIVRGGA